MLKNLTIEEIMDRLSRICHKQICNVRIRPDYPPGPSKWFVSLSGVVVGSINSGGFSSSITNNCDSGATPGEAIRNVWQAVLELSKNKECALMRYNCPPNVPIPGDEPEVWVRWNQDLDDWEDIPVSRLSPEKLRTYRDQVWRDKM